MNEKTKELINNNLLFAIEHLRRAMEQTSFTERKVALSKGIESISIAYKNVNYNNMEDFNNESN